MPPRLLSPGWRVSTSFILMLSISGSASAAWTPLAQSREVGAVGLANSIDFSDSDFSTHSAPDLGPYTKGVGFSVRAGTATGDGFASQTSSINPGLIALEISADAFVMAGEEESASGSASSSCYFEFELTEPTAVKIRVSSYVQGESGGSLFLTREGQLTPLIEYDACCSPGVRETKNFPAGKYFLSAYVGAGAFIEYSDGTPDGRTGIVAEFTAVPEPPSLALVAAALAGWPLAVRRRRANGPSAHRTS